nr:NADH dehydrogenase subunit 4 [Vignadula atrata]
MVSVKGPELGGWFYVDFTSYMLLVLSVYIILLVFFSSVMVGRFNSFSRLVISILVFLSIAFCVNSLIFFYFFFESVLLPTFILIMGWGYQPERIQAVLYMVVYTVVGSVPLLYGISKLYFFGSSLSFCSMESSLFKLNEVLPWFFFLAFMVKLPMFPFHIWLPKAHVEAPVAGSMILAGLLLKLGGYGMLRFSAVMEVGVTGLGGSLILIIALWGGVLTSLVCVRQVDLKCLVAYSSVGHMSFVMLGCLSGCGLGYLGAILIMVGHGLCSSGLFALVNILYMNSSSRLISLNKGCLSAVPSISLMCFLLCSSNMASPPSLNLMGEIMVYIVGVFFSWSVVVLLGVMSFMSACYSLYIYVGTQHGKPSGLYETDNKVSFSDLVNLLFHWLPLNFLFLFTLLWLLSYLWVVLRGV